MRSRSMVIAFCLALSISEWAAAQGTIEGCRNAPNPAVCVGKILDAKIDSIIQAVGAVTPVPPMEVQKISIYSRQYCDGLMASAFVPKPVSSQAAVMEAQRACNELGGTVANGQAVRTLKIGNSCIDANPPLANFQVAGKCLELASEHGG